MKSSNALAEGSYAPLFARGPDLARSLLNSPPDPGNSALVVAALRMLDASANSAAKPAAIEAASKSNRMDQGFCLIGLVASVQSEPTA